MSETLQYNTLWDILENIGIEIPPIQRDYAQGREIAKVDKIRNEFLDSIIHALDENKSLSLDFVYGKIHGLKNEVEHARNKQAIQSLLNTLGDYASSIDLKLENAIVVDKASTQSDFVYLIPLDGQQRLTTLFLLHWYIAKRLGYAEAITILSRFRYKTRKSSSSFLKLLTDLHTKIEFTPETCKKEKVSEGAFFESLKNNENFSIVWLADPTVHAMMVMLQEIHYKLQCKLDGELQHYWNGLVHDQLINFSFLDLKDFNLSDELYVKINGRGKQLSTFENFKAWLFGVIEDEHIIDSTLWNSYKQKFDIDWNDLFWKYKADGVYDIDNAYFNYFKLRFLIDLTINLKVTAKEYNHSKEKEEIESIINRKDLDFEKVFDKRFKNRLNSYFKTLEYFVSSNSDLLASKIYSFDENNNFWFRSDSSFRWIDIIRKYAYLCFVEYNFDKLNDQNFDYFKHYWRVVSNLLNNQTFDNIELYQGALREITEINRYMSLHKTSIFKWLELKHGKSVFTEEQLKEEKLKWELIKNDSNWEDCFIEAEKETQFKGKIGFLLTICNQDLNQFKSVYARVAPLFRDNILNHKDFLLQRALLTYGNYFEPRGNEIYYFYKNENNTYRSRRENWLGFLNKQNKGGLIEQLINNPSYDNSNIESSLNTIIKSFIDNNRVDHLLNSRLDSVPYHHLYIHCSQLFTYGESKLIKLFQNKYAYQLNKTNTGGYFNDVILEFIKFTYFNTDNNVKIHKTKGWGNRPSIEFKNHFIMVVPSENKVVVKEGHNSIHEFTTINEVVQYINSEN